MNELKRVREQALLTEEERDNCTPSNKQLEDFLAEPDDEVAAKLRTEEPEMFKVIGRCLLYGRNVAQAQLDKALKDGGILLKSDDQRLPKNPEPDPTSDVDVVSYEIYASAQRAMLKPDSEGNHWVKVGPKEKP